MDNHPDYLRTPETVCKPDRRSPTTSFLGNQPLTVAYQHGVIADISLHKNVPDDIRIQFETTKNLYLYAWFVYRFYPVAKHHAYTCLELALRERFEAELLAAGVKKREFGPGFKQLFKYAVKNGYVKNEGFELWRRQTEQRAKRRSESVMWEEAQRNGLNEITFYETQYEIKDEDRDHEYVELLIESLPWLRNHYAHGSTSLDNQALGTIRLVAEIINQIY